MADKYSLNVKCPQHFSYVVRNVPEVTVEQRTRALEATHYNEFAFPAGMLTVDMLSDSGTDCQDIDRMMDELYLCEYEGGPENVPLIFTCITNNPVCGQPVSMANLKAVHDIAHKYNKKAQSI